MKKVYDCGIDLGTTNSCIAVSKDGNSAEIIESTTDNLSTTPSAVYVSKSGKIMVGQAAYQNLDRKNVALQFKRLMGMNEKNLFAGSQMEKSPEELSAEILKKLRQDYLIREGKEARDAVITIPAAFTSMQNEATQKAARLAGFSNILLLQEPIAASIAYGMKPDTKDHFWMVFDYGGGTLDVAIVSTFHGRLKVLNTEGNNFFGGCDLDREVLEKIVLPRLRREYTIGEPVRPALKNRLLFEIENVKKALGSAESASLFLSGVVDDEMEEIEFDCDITRKEFDEAIRDVVDEGIRIAEKALQGSNITADQLEKIILVGGSTYVQLVRQRLAEVFGKEVDSSVNPMHAVAIGAAIFASGNYVDVEESELDASPEQETEGIRAEISYLPQTDSDKAAVRCVFHGIKEEGFSVTICSEEWKSGKLAVKDQCVKTRLELPEEGINRFSVKLFDTNGTPCDYAGEHTIEIMRKKQNMKISSAPLTHSVCVGVMNNGYEQLDVVIKKNTLLPAANSVIYQLNKTIHKGSEDEITFKIYEGEIYDNPIANTVAGVIHIKGKDLSEDLRANTEVELHLAVDENRIIHVWGCFQETGVQIPETQLLEKTQPVLEESLYGLEQYMEGMRISIRNIQNADQKQAAFYQSRFEKMYEQYEKYLDQYDAGEADPESNDVYKFIEEFYGLHTSIVREERKLKKVSGASERMNKVLNLEKMQQNYGTPEGREVTKEWKLRIEQARSEEEAERYMKELYAAWDRDCSQNIEFIHNWFSNLKVRVSERQMENDPRCQKLCSECEEAYEERNLENMMGLVRNLETYIYSEHNAFTEEKELLEQLKEDTGLDIGSRKVQMLIHDGEEAVRTQDIERLKEINQHLKSLRRFSATQQVENSRSDLKKG